MLFKNGNKYFCAKSEMTQFNNKKLIWTPISHLKEEVIIPLGFATFFEKITKNVSK